MRDPLRQVSSDIQLFYRTDHHWTTDAAFEAWRAVSDTMGLTGMGTVYTPACVCDSFSGSLVNKSGFPAKKKDRINIFFPDDAYPKYVITYNNEHRKSASCYQPEFLEGEDPYQVFFGGNHPCITIETTADTNRTLIVFKDSYANCFLPFLLPDFKRIVVVDPRYYYEDIHSLMAQEAFTDILFLYNVSTLAEDNSLSLVLGMDEE